MRARNARLIGKRIGVAPGEVVTSLASPQRCGRNVIGSSLRTRTGTPFTCAALMRIAHTTSMAEASNGHRCSARQDGRGIGVPLDYRPESDARVVPSQTRPGPGRHVRRRPSPSGDGTGAMNRGPTGVAALRQGGHKPARGRGASRSPPPRASPDAARLDPVRPCGTAVADAPNQPDPVSHETILDVLAPELPLSSTVTCTSTEAPKDLRTLDKRVTRSARSRRIRPGEFVPAARTARCGCIAVEIASESRRVAVELNAGRGRRRKRRRRRVAGQVGVHQPVVGRSRAPAHHHVRGRRVHDGRRHRGRCGGGIGLQV